MLLDTDVCIEVLRARTPKPAERLRSLGAVALSSITVSELAYGAAHSKDPMRNGDEVRRFLAAVPVYAFDDQAAWQAGAIRHELAAAGTPIGGYDLLIAGQARARGDVLVTGNVREFARVPGLVVEPW